MSKIRAHSTLSQQYSVVKTYMKYLPVAKDGDQNKLETEALLFTRNNKRSGAFCTAFIAEMDVFFPLLSQILRPFGKWIKDDFYLFLKFEHRSMIREVGTTDSHQRNVLKCGEKVGTSKLF